LGGDGEDGAIGGGDAANGGDAVVIDGLRAFVEVFGDGLGAALGDVALGEGGGGEEEERGEAHGGSIVVLLGGVKGFDPPLDYWFFLRSVLSSFGGRAFSWAGRSCCCAFGCGARSCRCWRGFSRGGGRITQSMSYSRKNASIACTSRSSKLWCSISNQIPSKPSLAA